MYPQDVQKGSKMPTANPHVGTEFEKVWQDGYDIALSSPPDVPSPPAVLTPENAQLWSEGALVGNADGQAEGWRVRLDVDGEGLKPEMEWLGAGAEITYQAAAVAVVGFKALGELPLTILLLLIDLEAKTPTDQDVMATAGRALSVACTQQGITEAFLALCTTAREHPGGDDGMLDVGYWHGTFATSFDAASAEATKHQQDAPDHNVGVLRFQPSDDAANFWEWLPVPL
jgi:hypothetical protein